MHADVANLSWTIVVALAVLGGILLGFGFKGFNSDKIDKKDSLGVDWSERFGIITLNGLTFLLAALVAALLKIFS